jgi:hypothetical protein
MTQCSRRPNGLPACFLALSLSSVVLPLSAQEQRYRVVRQESFRQEAGAQGRLLASVPAGVRVTGGAAHDGWVQVSLEGWIWGASVGRTDRDGHNLAVTAARGENLRSAPNGPVIARLLSGFLLDEMSRDAGWARVRRVGWLPEPALAVVTGSDTAAVTVGALDTTSDSAIPRPAGSALDRAVLARESELVGTPASDGKRAGSLAAETPVRILARSGDWVRVQTEGWMRESDLRSTAPGLISGLTAAELRTHPQEYEGKLVQWTLQFLSIATADELRPEIPPGQRYLLARGPLPEAGFVYVTLSGAQQREAEQLPPLAQIVVVARIRNGRSKYLGNPVIDLVEMRVRQP